jgi:hypothetical protein
MRNEAREKLKDFAPGSPELARLYQNVFGTPEGQIVFEDLKIQAFAYDTTAGEFIRENEGRRQMILHIQKALEVDTNPTDSVVPE